MCAIKFHQLILNSKRFYLDCRVRVATSAVASCFAVLYATVTYIYPTNQSTDPPTVQFVQNDTLSFALSLLVNTLHKCYKQECSERKICMYNSVHAQHAEHHSMAMTMERIVDKCTWRDWWICSVPICSSPTVAGNNECMWGSCVVCIKGCR